MNDVERILEKFANMPLRDFLETVRLQQQRNNNLEDKIKVLQSRLSNSIDLVCIFQKKEEKIIADNRLLLRDNVNLTFAERIKANDDLNLVLEKQQKLQKEALQTEMNALQMAYETNANDENKLALMQKEVEMLQ